MNTGKDLQRGRCEHGRCNESKGSYEGWEKWRKADEREGHRSETAPGSKRRDNRIQVHGGTREDQPFSDGEDEKPRCHDVLPHAVQDNREHRPGHHQHHAIDAPREPAQCGRWSKRT